MRSGPRRFYDLGMPTVGLAGGHYQRAVGAAHDGELGEVVVLEPIEGESSDVGLGIMLGLLLGFVSVVCLVEDPVPSIT